MAWKLLQSKNAARGAVRRTNKARRWGSAMKPHIQHSARNYRGPCQQHGVRYYAALLGIVCATGIAYAAMTGWGA